MQPFAYVRSTSYAGGIYTGTCVYLSIRGKRIFVDAGRTRRLAWSTSVGSFRPCIPECHKYTAHVHDAQILVPDLL
jgi:hypothetical protein